MEQAESRKRDVFAWIGVFVDVVQAILFVVGGLGLLFWYVSHGGGLPAVVVAMAIAILVLVGLTIALLIRRR